MTGDGVQLCIPPLHFPESTTSLTEAIGRVSFPKLAEPFPGAILVSLCGKGQKLIDPLVLQVESNPGVSRIALVTVPGHLLTKLRSGLLDRSFITLRPLFPFDLYSAVLSQLQPHLTPPLS